MKTGIGIDTGGTYTDAVLYDFENKKILSHAKALTTREDLSIGIGNALDGLSGDFFSQVELISLSTTLATNACVEEKGGRARLVFIGMDKKIIEDVGESYGLNHPKAIFFLDSEVAGNGDIVAEPDWKEFAGCCRDEFGQSDAVGIVALHAMNNNAVQEKQAKKIVESELQIPVICGHELFSDINCVQRGASILLNARLVPVIKEFLLSIKTALLQRNIKAPAVIVRSDGSLMSEEFTSLRPVETLLCGPAASVLGGITLTNQQNAIIVDMGGTTTDIALVKNGTPVLVKNGIQIGKWKTFVKGLFIDTCGLGGDSAVRYKNRKLYLDSGRVVPLCIAAEKYPSITEKLNTLLHSGKTHDRFLHEFFVPVRDIASNPNYDDNEKSFCEKLKAGPMSLEEAARSMGKDIYTFRISRLEREGIVMRAGLTPTDIMHLKGDFTRYNSKASALGAQYIAECLGITPEKLYDKVYYEVKLKLYSNIVRILLQNKYPHLEKAGLNGDIEMLITESFRKKDRGMIDMMFQTPSVLVGIGAPIHIFLPDVARALHTEYVVPEYANVANALGAVVGNVSAVCSIEVKPKMLPDKEILYTVYGKDKNTVFTRQDEAEAEADREARDSAVAEAIKRGAGHDLSVSSEVFRDTARTAQGKMYLGSRAVATAVGRISF